MADEFNGKVVSEKKVRAANTLGRDFTIKGKPDDAPGVIMVRIRQYLIGRSIYAVMVVSPPNHELPLDAGRFLGSLAIGEAMKRAAGTPEPEPTGTEIKGWGLAIDPKKDCKITPVEKSVTIEVPGVFHDLNADNAKLDAPRLMREVDGDFVMTAKVTGEFKPGPKSTNPKVVPYLGAGILIWSDSDNYIRFERAAMLRDGKHLHSIRMEEREGGYPGAIFSKTLKAAGDYYIRIERKGSRINAFISADSKTWERLDPIDTVWPSRLRVGLSVVTSSSEPVSIKFEEVEFKAKGGDAEKK
jgi:regulation of enolase protein 1 (concanavalin A-like superfamily)